MHSSTRALAMEMTASGPPALHSAAAHCYAHLHIRLPLPAGQTNKHKPRSSGRRAEASDLHPPNRSARAAFPTTARNDSAEVKTSIWMLYVYQVSHSRFAGRLSRIGLDVSSRCYVPAWVSTVERERTHVRMVCGNVHGLSAGRPIVIVVYLRSLDRLVGLRRLMHIVSPRFMNYSREGYLLYTGRNWCMIS